MARPINRYAVVEIIKEGFKGKEEPLVAFPDKAGFPNVVYLYHDKARELYDDVSQLMARASVALETPVMMFIEPLYKAPKTAMTCSDWLR